MQRIECISIDAGEKDLAMMMMSHCKSIIIVDSDAY